MEPTPYAECSSEAPGLEATGKKDSPFQPGLRVLACSAGQVQLCAESVLETITESRKRKLDTDAGLHNVNCVGVSAVVRHESLRYRER